MALPRGRDPALSPSALVRVSKSAVCQLAAKMPTWRAAVAPSGQLRGARVAGISSPRHQGRTNSLKADAVKNRGTVPRVPGFHFPPRSHDGHSSTLARAGHAAAREPLPTRFYGPDAAPWA